MRRSRIQGRDYGQDHASVADGDIYDKGDRYCRRQGVPYCFFLLRQRVVDSDDSEIFYCDTAVGSCAPKKRKCLGLC